MYCFGCNERFAAASDSICPRCGIHADADHDAMDDTLLLRADDSGASMVETPSAKDDELSHLVGESLHVYRCDKLIGRGGMGHVFLAHHNDLHRQCALKILSPRMAEHDQDYVRRFQHEGRSAAALVHPNVVTVHAIGESDTFHFLEMEYVSGKSLQHLINIEKSLPPIRATVLMAGAARGLSVAHQSGMLHRDLKLDNILLTSTGVPKIADFGLAKRVMSDLGDDLQTSYLVGTPSYMAPELFHGIPSSPMTDVYALGVCFFVLLTGRSPYTADSLNELIDIIQNASVPNVREFCDDVSLDIAECVSLMMAKTPGNRPKDATEAMQLLMAILGEARDIESLLSEAFPGTEGVTWIRQDKQYVITVDLPNSRRQTVIVEPSDHKASERLLVIYSTCCDADPNYFEQALKLNSELSHCSIGLRVIDDVQRFVMTNAYPRATADVEEVRESVKEIAEHADAVEKLLTGEDRH